ncbi:MAG: 1-acyl-sn-glycerol-3-phosphate acyltransferase [Candidatus Omnitrophica bacterium]|nr:1-acyl-sn-glycerol-3-phosphate acyltransferase [Candidatus Omnitrophota bacterium]
MKWLFKTFFLFLSIFLCSLTLLFLRLIFFFWPVIKMRAAAFTVHVFGRIFVFILGIKVKITGQKELLKSRGVFLVSNHLGYIDGIVATSLTPLIFVAKADIRSWPFFGFFTFLSDTVFVNRQNPAQIKKEIEKITGVLKNKVNIIIFPEGTSTNGEKLLPFKSSFFSAPLKARAKIVPLVVTYKSLNHCDIDSSNRDLVYWYGTMKFFPHLLNVLKQDSITLEIKVCSPLEIKNENPAQEKQLRKATSDACWSIIGKNLSREDALAG